MIYNLIMGFGLEHESTADVRLSRVFEYTSDELMSSFKINGEINFEKLRRFPCLLLSEGRANSVARIGTIDQLETLKNQLRISIAYDPNVPEIPNSAIFERRASFGISDEWEFSRTHWAVKRSDLYRAALPLMLPHFRMPSAFEIAPHQSVDSELISVMMPFSSDFVRVFEEISRHTEQIDIKCLRADSIWENSTVIQDIVSLIDRSFAVIADCTGKNPNVFYEIGIAHTLGKEVILITQNDADIPFDLRHHRYVKYLNNTEGLSDLVTRLTARIETLKERAPV